jgi:XTP/dITP diphosphohydrolase
MLVVPLAPDEIGFLTLAEWDALRAAPTVLFERPEHPLLARLRGEGVSILSLDGGSPAPEDVGALVADPGSPLILELAHAGASVSSGPASVPDAVTAAHGAGVARRASSALGGLAGIMARLRSTDGCPWDREQSHTSLEVHLQEEVAEVLEAIDAGNVGAELQEELGDLLLQVAFHAQLASEEGRFDIADVADGISAKLLHRHPHVFGDVAVAGAEEVVTNWEAIKAREKERSDVFGGIPAGLPALLGAYKTQKRAAALGWSADEVRARTELAAQLQGPLDQRGLGEALFWLVALARAAGVDPEGALRAAIARFRTSF